MKKNREFEHFDNAMRQLIRVSRTDLKAALDAEKAAKKQRKAKRNDKSN